MTNLKSSHACFSGQPDMFISRFHRSPTPVEKVLPEPIHSRFLTHPRPEENPRSEDRSRLEGVKNA